MNNRFLFFIVGVFVFFLFVESSPAGRRLLTDGELDQVAATGNAERNPETGVKAEKTTVAAHLSVQPRSQSNVSALTVNNVVGENLVANGININSGAHSPHIGR